MIALCVHLKNSIAIMVLAHSTLGKQMRPNFLRSISLLYKILPTSLGTCKPTFYTFYKSHLRWNSTMRRCFFLSYRPRTECSISQFCNTNCTHSIFRTIEARVSETVKKISKITYTASWFSLLTSAKVDCLNKINTVIRFNI